MANFAERDWGPSVSVITAQSSAERLVVEALRIRYIALELSGPWCQLFDETNTGQTITGDMPAPALPTKATITV